MNVLVVLVEGGRWRRGGGGAGSLSFLSLD